MICYRMLENVKLETIHIAFVEAFSDYQVKIDLPFWKFQQMLKRRGFDPTLSIGAFEDERLIAFVLNGFRDWNGKKTVYDLGTGVIADYRRRGVTSEMLQQVKERMRERGIDQYLLEVLQNNQSAVLLYQKQGFEIQRTFSCYHLDKNNLSQKTAYSVESVESIDLEMLKEFWDFRPSWQNSIESVKAVPEDFHYAIVRNDNIIIGYGIIDKRTGDIPQIAVHKEHRGKGIASNIVTELAKNTEALKLSILNIETPLKSVEDFLFKVGFTSYVGQYEMLLKVE
ncbi:GNAT family N-acetyltransferase [Lachnoclostridium phytofermentans]|uniref:GCN5-related N-acetyltransferase n=1 Tax=Lachnoclostridium phytofermentans (strain ATCC 700394 / DSM 18823 / ISDg) TaxID=357809 RepID=A9KLN4_LACP7|nr:GNAT family N-acetyltransferase [Lachnoclostridium phytofermentans]ABX42778.1 GCN5-related N-acetyltransferase [Lachnoclostridium phytofermentans ISDg]